MLIFPAQPSSRVTRPVRHHVEPVVQAARVVASAEVGEMAGAAVSLGRNCLPSNKPKSIANTALDAEAKAVTVANSNLVVAAFSSPVDKTTIAKANDELAKARAAWATKASKLFAETQASDKKLSQDAINRLVQTSSGARGGRGFGPGGPGGPRGGGRPGGPSQ